MRQMQRTGPDKASMHISTSNAVCMPTLEACVHGCAYQWLQREEDIEIVS